MIQLSGSLLIFCFLTQNINMLTLSQDCYCVLDGAQLIVSIFLLLCVNRAAGSPFHFWMEPS